MRFKVVLFHLISFSMLYYKYFYTTVFDRVSKKHTAHQNFNSIYKLFPTYYRAINSLQLNLIFNDFSTIMEILKLYFYSCHIVSIVIA